MASRDRLVKLIEHWIAHNASHAQRYVDEATAVEADGYDEVAAQLRQAADLSTHVSAALRAALAALA